MKKSSLSLVALLALAANANAQSLEEAIRGVEVNGFLRYEYEDNRFKNQGFDANGERSGDVEHTWHAEAEFKAPVADYLALNLGIYYEGSNNVNHGKGIDLNDGGVIDSSEGAFGYGLGSGKDNSFGVSTFNALITPDSTNTNITLGKMRLDTPFNDSGEDRGTGILAVNSDLPNISLVAGAFDSWALDDLKDDLPAETSITKPLYLLAGVGNWGLDFGDIEGQLWWFCIDEILDSAFFGQLGFYQDLFHINGQYAYAQTTISGVANLVEALGGTYEFMQTKSDFISLEVGVDFASFEIPLSLNLGYITNTKDNFAISLDDEGALQLAGAVWFDNYDATGVNFSAISGAIPRGESKDLGVFYASLAYDLLENLSIGIDYVSGTNKVKEIPNNLTTKIDFSEITPNLIWAYNDNLEIGVYYALLKTKRNGSYTALKTDSENRNQFKVEIVYEF